MGDRNQHDVAALAAVPSVGATAGHVRFAAEADAAVAAVTTLDEDLDLVDEHGDRPGRADGAPLARGGQHGHELSPRTVVLEADEAVDESEQGVVLAQPHVPARLPAGAVLPDDDGPAA